MNYEEGEMTIDITSAVNWRVRISAAIWQQSGNVQDSVPPGPLIIVFPACLPSQPNCSL